jgi:hypothetical protein
MGRFSSAQNLAKMSQQMRDVLAAHSQRRNRQWQHMQPIEQIFTKCPLLTRSSSLRLVAE